MAGRAEYTELLGREDWDGLIHAARQRTGAVLRFLTGRLYSTDEAEKMRAVRGFGAVVGDREVVDHRRAEDLLHRFFWALNDESGTVPYGVPEAIGEILAHRREFLAGFLPVLCAMITHEEMIQTGPIERGVLWALGRIGPPVQDCSPRAVKGIAHASAFHPEEATREIAAWALHRIRDGG
jgi:hypothetical protein